MKLSTSLLALIVGEFAAVTVASFFGGQLPLTDLSADLKVPGESPLYYCDDKFKDSILHLKYINMDPNPPLRGLNLTIAAAGTLDSTIEEGAYVQVIVKYGYIKIWSGTVDLCEQSKTVNETCPIAKGTRDLETTVEMPQNIPPGKYAVFAEAFTVDDERITCITAEVVFPA